MQRTHILLAVLAVMAATAASVASYLMAGRDASPDFHGTDLGPGFVAPDFTLDAADRGSVSLSDLQGRAVLMFFGYTQCPDVCPLTMSKLRFAVEKLGDRRDDVEVLLITVDPEEDSPERLEEYLLSFDPRFIGLGGTREELQAVAASYGAYMGRVQPPTNQVGDDDPHAAHQAHRPPPRLIDHTSQVFGIDRRGNFRLLWGSEATAEQIAEDLLRLLRL